jgi:hypothetical protein
LGDDSSKEEPEKSGDRKEGRRKSEKSRNKRNDVRMTSDEDELLHNNIIITMAACNIVDHGNSRQSLEASGIYRSIALLCGGCQLGLVCQ